MIQVFKEGETLVRVRGDQKDTLDRYPIGSRVTVLNIATDELFDADFTYSYYLKFSDFERIEDVETGVKDVFGCLENIKKLPKGDDKVNKLTDAYKKLQALQEELGKVLPEILEDIQEAKIKKGDFSVEQLLKLIKLGKVVDLEGTYFHGDGRSEEMFLNVRTGAIRPPVDIFKDEDTFDVDHIELELLGCEDTLSTNQVKALLSTL